jgi:ABC-type proline/glycine betaine transport system ATPase subunit
MGMSDRIIAMADGQVIASGTPDIVRNDPAVVEAYLGGSMAAIERSGVAAVRGSDAEVAPETERPVVEALR